MITVFLRIRTAIKWNLCVKHMILITRLHNRLQFKSLNLLIKQLLCIKELHSTESVPKMFLKVFERKGWTYVHLIEHKVIIITKQKNDY